MRFRLIIVLVSGLLLLQLGFGNDGHADNKPVAILSSTWTELITKMEFAKIPGGCFEMGSPAGEIGRDEDEGPIHEVCVEPFFIGKYEVTQKQWERIMDDNPSFNDEGDDYPVEQVSWEDVQTFIEKLNKRADMTFRLPTEAEWEYAARAKTATARYWESEEKQACECANVHDETSKRDNRFSWKQEECDDGYATTAPIGQFEPNRFGVHDMLGNVWEWCQDNYSGSYYSKSPKENPQGPRDGSLRVIRGGGWYYGSEQVRAASRRYAGPGMRDNRIGFRLLIQR